MKRFHVHVSVEDLDQSIRFYSTLFGTDIPDLSGVKHRKCTQLHLAGCRYKGCCRAQGKGFRA